MLWTLKGVLQLFCENVLDLSPLMYLCVKAKQKDQSESTLGSCIIRKR